MTTLTWDRHKGHASSYDVVELGYNYRIDEIRAALGMVQLRKLALNNEHRRRLTQVYRDALQELAPQVTVPICRPCRYFCCSLNASAFASRFE